MSQSPVIRKLVHDAPSRWSEFLAIFSNSNLPMVIVFCLLGLLLSFSFILRFPDLGALIEQYNKF